MMTRRAPTTDSKVRRIRCSRAWVSTSIVTSSGTSLSSTSLRTKSKSVCEALGNPTSISLKPTSHTVRNMRSLRSRFMGSNSDWLPSRRSVLIQIGGCVMVRLGHWRSGKGMAGKAWYLVDGCESIHSSGKQRLRAHRCPNAYRTEEPQAVDCEIGLKANFLGIK